MSESIEHKRRIVRFPAEHEKDVIDYLKTAFKERHIPILVRDDKTRKKSAANGTASNAKTNTVVVDVNPGIMVGGAYTKDIESQEVIVIDSCLSVDDDESIKAIISQLPKFNVETASAAPVAADASAEPDDEAGAEAESDNGMKWYAVRTSSGKEKEAKKLLEHEIASRRIENLIAQVLVPTEKVVETDKRTGKKKLGERLFYPGYIFVKANMTPEIQGLIREPEDIAGVLSIKGKSVTDRIAIPLRPAEVKRLLGQAEDNENGSAEISNPFLINDAVRITEGPFNGFEGSVEEVLDDKKKVKVIVKIFGRKTSLELNYSQVTKE
jgi:transcriptional antiterminator NusG